MHEVTVLGGSMTIATPPGYCIDPKASAARGKAVVVMIGRCRAEGQVAPAVVSVTVGASASAGVLLAGPDALAKFFTSAQGRTLLARDGHAGRVIVMQALVAKGSLFLHVKDQTAGEYWRAISAMQGRLVTVSASGTKGTPLTPDQGFRLVQDVLAVLAVRNPDMAPPRERELKRGFAVRVHRRNGSAERFLLPHQRGGTLTVLGAIRERFPLVIQSFVRGRDSRAWAKWRDLRQV